MYSSGVATAGGVEMTFNVAFSGGKDSTAMLLRMMELEEDIEKIVFCDTLFEFPEMYEYIRKIQQHINREITILHPPEGEWERWFYGEITRGEGEGNVRGAPLQFYPCYWSRESKVKPLVNLQKEGNVTCVGIAFDEQERIGAYEGVRFPLIEWRWTEAKCAEYLNEKGLFNPLYVNFNRTGCYLCPKQGETALWVLWKLYPELWKRAKFWDEESMRVAGHWLKEVSLDVYEKDFEKEGYSAPNLPKYGCWSGCEAVKKAFASRQSNVCEWGV